MLHCACLFFALSLGAAAFGFGGSHDAGVETAQLLYPIFAILALVAYLFALAGRVWPGHRTHAGSERPDVLFRPTPQEHT